MTPRNYSLLKGPSRVHGPKAKSLVTKGVKVPKIRGLAKIAGSPHPAGLGTVPGNAPRVDHRLLLSPTSGSGPTGLVLEENL